jgi:hypothetical protein
MQINATLIPTAVPPGSPFGAVYSYTDSNVVPGTTYYYWLEVLSLSGYTDLKGPVEARVPAASEMHIGSITMSYTAIGKVPGMAVEKSPGHGYAIVASTEVLDAAGAPVNAARVAVRWTLPGGLGTQDGRGVANKNGTVTFMIHGSEPGAYEVCVTDAVKAGWTYAPARNAETCKVLILP